MRVIAKSALHRICVAACLYAAAMSASAQDASRLGRSLTPAGGEAGPSASGIPAYVGKEDPLPGWSPGKTRGEYWKHKGDKPLLTIDASNVDKHADKLSPGQVATVKSIPGYKMDIYPTRRTCGVPDFVAENTRKNVGFAKIGDDGWSLREAMVPGYPFPMPTTGVQAMLNWKMRYRGIAMEYQNVVAMVSPSKGSGQWITGAVDSTYFTEWGAKGSRPLSKVGNADVRVYITYTSPTALAGQSFVISTFLDQPAETFYYFPGQRRVRRMPSYAYDAPQIGFENQYLMDEPNMFWGTLDRFDWKLVGKKELYVPYNVFGVHDFAGKRDEIVAPSFVNTTHRRYEMHRVWVVEATVKSGTRHIAPKRTYYLDEDSWAILLGEDYDGQGKLWKAREGYVIPVFETGSCDVSAFAQYNLNEGRWVFDGHTAGTGKDVRWVVEGDGPRYKPSFYTADNLRTISDR